MNTLTPGQRLLEELSPEDLRLLHERARDLAKSSGRDLVDATNVELLEVASRGQTYALPLESVEGVAELTSIAFLPLAPSFVRGLVGFRGEAMVATEISGMFGESQIGFADLKRIISVAAGGKKLCILAERVMTVRTARLSDFILDPTSNVPFIIGTDCNLVSLINPALFIEFAFKALGGVDEL